MNALQPSYHQLRALGHRLFGPVCAPAVMWIAETVSRRPDRPVLFLSREGYHLRRLVAESLRLLRLPAPPLEYLVVSRTLVFRLLLAMEDEWRLGLVAHYQGTLESLMRERFGLNADEIAELDLPSLPSKVNLPDERDQAMVAEVLASRRAVLQPTFLPRLDAYRAYVDRLSRGAAFTVVDIGYSGTIQRGLSALLPHELDGLYFFLLGDAAGTASPIVASAFWKGRGGFGSGDPLIDLSLVLESVLTSPDGQVVDLDPHGRGLRADSFVYREGTQVQKLFQITHALMDGVQDFIRDMADGGVSPQSLPDLIDVGAAYQSLLRLDQSDEMKFLRQFCEVDDAISGFGVINPFSFLAGLRA